MITSLIKSEGVSGISVNFNLADIYQLNEHFVYKMRACKEARERWADHCNKWDEERKKEAYTTLKEWSEKRDYEARFDEEWAKSLKYESYKDYITKRDYRIENTDMDTLLKFFEKLQTGSGTIPTIFD